MKGKDSRAPLATLFATVLILWAGSSFAAQVPPEEPPVRETAVEEIESNQGEAAPITEPDPAPEALGLVAGRPRVTPIWTNSPPLIYGVLDDEVWATDVLIAYDSERIYFGFHARYEDPTIMRANRVERDRTFQDDLITLYFNTFMDQQRGYEFDVNGFGVQGEGVISGGGGGRWRGPPQRSRGRTGLGTGSSILAVRSSRMVSQRRWRSPSRAYGIRAHRMGSPTAGDVRILRATTNLQIPERLDLRNIAEFNSQDKTVDFNVLFNYQVDAGTVFYLGYDDHFQQADLIEGDRDGDRLEEQLFFTTGQRRTSRALFIKLQSLLRY